MSDLDAILDGSLLAAAGHVAKGEVSAAELTGAALRRIGSSEMGAGYFLRLRPDEALAEAARIDALGRDQRHALPLCGVPWARKDLFSVPGEPTSFGAHAGFGKTGRERAPVIDALRSSGGIDMGALHMSEFAMGPSGWSSVYGAIENPLDQTRVTGGSSSGSAASVGGRFVFAALGTDTGGSNRIPAAFCGVVSLKPGSDRISTEGALPVSTTLDTVGPFARSVEDCTAVFSCLAGKPARTVEERRLRFAVLASGSLPVAPQPEVGQALEHVAALLSDEGYPVEERWWDAFADTNILAGSVFLSEAAAAHLPNLTAHADWIGPQVRERLLQGLATPAPVYLSAMKARAARRQRFAEQVLSGVDVLLLPVSPARAPLRSQYKALKGNGDILKLNGHVAAYTAAFNYLDLPVLSMPATSRAERNTLGLQIVARHGDDETALAAGRLIERLLG
ncbi:amidase [Nitratireductor indicus C115]|uniref:Amidase n=1 Tax=Nitratireductor indicus C115 TaxID=1231190 RepID=K2PAK3_9HYPH|nr:amidase [Nitratireductor indicus]EKF44156.1 amidase [Nitratireductor indicus C115]SFQ24376.1 aspartyl-tRNA(Asn)/glutamyl-tRNA(Gln) amidotransferase subunit A [Nitratireductor indicus]